MLCASLMGGAWGEWPHLYIYMAEFLCCSLLKLPQHCSSAIPQYKRQKMKKKKVYILMEMD